MKRLGQLKYSEIMLQDHPEVIKMLYCNFVPLDMKFDAVEDTYYVKGISNAFRPFVKGERIPFYDVSVTHTTTGNRDFETSLQFMEVIA